MAHYISSIPKKGKDPGEIGELETLKVIKSATAKRRLPRYE